MTTKVISWIAKDLNEWKNQKGNIVYYVNVKFEDGDSGSVGKEDKAIAEELFLLLEGLVDQEADFQLEDNGKKNSDGLTKWKINAFPGWDPVPYTPKYSGNGKAQASSPEREDSIARAVALKAAAYPNAGAPGLTVLRLAEQYLAWLQGEAPSAGATDPATKAASRSLSQAAPADGLSDAALELGKREAASEQGSEGSGEAVPGPDELDATPGSVSTAQKQRMRELDGSIPEFTKRRLSPGKSLSDYSEKQAENILTEAAE